MDKGAEARKPEPKLETSFQHDATMITDNTPTDLAIDDSVMELEPIVATKDAVSRVLDLTL
jgi:hypothetical protein